MALPKALRDKIAALLKDGAELPKELDDGQFFENDGEFLSAAEKRTRAKVTEAERKAQQAAKDSRDAALAEVFEKIGIKDADQIDEIKAKLAAAEGTLTETERLKTDHKRALKDLEKRDATIAELNNFKVNHIKRSAVNPYLAKIVPDLHDLVLETLLPKLVIGEGDKVTAPEGKGIDVFVDELIKAKPSLKVPDYKPGAGTGQGESKPKGDGAGTGGGSGDGTNGKAAPTTIAGALAAEMAKAAGVAR